MSEMKVVKRKQLEGKAAMYVGPYGQFAVGNNDHRWYYTLDNELYIGPYRRRIQVQRAWDAHRSHHV